MSPRMIFLGIAVALLTAGCGGGGAKTEGLSRVEVEKRVAREVGDREGQKASAECAERIAERMYRCAVDVASTGSIYDVLVSKDGQRVQLIAR